MFLDLLDARIEEKQSCIGCYIGDNVTVAMSELRLVDSFVALIPFHASVQIENGDKTQLFTQNASTSFTTVKFFCN